MKRKKQTRGRRTRKSGRYLFNVISLVVLVLGALGWLFGTYVFEGREGWGNAALNTEYWSLKVHGAGVMLILVALGMAVEPWRETWRKAKQGQRSQMALAGLWLGLLILSGWLLYYGPTSSIQDLIILAHWVLGVLAIMAFGFWFWVLRPER